MQYPFEHKEHEVYANTFLQSIGVEYHYGSKSKGIRPESINRFMKDKFKLDIDFSKMSFPINISSKDHLVKMSFGETVFKLQVKVNAYAGFSTLYPFLETGKNFMSLIKEDNVKKLAIRKINMWPYKNVRGANTAKEIILKKIFSKELLEGINAASLGNTSSVMWDKVFENKNDDIQEKINIKFGFLFPENNLLNDVPDDILILDTSIEQDVDLDSASIINSLKEMNQVLFDAYHWSVNPSIIDIMKGGNKNG